MNQKNTVKRTGQLVVMAALLGFASVASAGKQGISFYGGLGLSGFMPQEDVPREYDPAAAGNIFLAIEEDGWALEYNALRSVETGTNVSGTDYAAGGTITSLGYRTLETSGGLYFLLSFGLAKIDIDFSDATATNHTEGNVFTLGMGMRLDKTERIELDYSFYSSDAVDTVAGDTSLGDVHMVSLRYIWGGTPYDPRF